MKQTKLQLGFTLMELLIVIAIIGILISLGVVSYSSAQKAGRDSRRRSDMKAIQNAWEQYYADNSGSYPATCNFATLTTYLPGGIPADPKSGGTYSGTCTASSYCYCATIESGSGNATAANCTYGTGQYFCVSNLQ